MTTTKRQKILSTDEKKQTPSSSATTKSTQKEPPKLRLRTARSSDEVAVRVDRPAFVPYELKADDECSMDEVKRSVGRKAFARGLAILDALVTKSKTYSFHAVYHVNRGSCHHGLGLFDDALEDFDRACHLNPRSAVARFKKAQTLKKMRRLEEAVSSLKSAAEIDSKQPNIRVELANVYFSLKDWEAALAAADDALRLSDDKSLGAHEIRMCSLRRLNRAKNSIRNVRIALKLRGFAHSSPSFEGTSENPFPSHKRRIYSACLLSAAQELVVQDDNAETAFKALDLGRRIWNTYALELFAGSTHSGRGEHEKAIEHFSVAADLVTSGGSSSPSTSVQRAQEREAQLLLGASLCQLERYHDAVRPLEISCRLFALQPPSAANSRSSNASRPSASEEADEHANDSLTASFYLGLSYLNDGQYAAAVEPLRRVVDADAIGEGRARELKIRATPLLASTLLHSGKIEAAYDVLLQFTSELSTDEERTSSWTAQGEIHFQTGYAAMLLGKYDDARSNYLRCLKRNPEHERASQCLKRLDAANRMRPAGRERGDSAILHDAVAHQTSTISEPIMPASTLRRFSSAPVSPRSATDASPLASAAASVAVEDDGSPPDAPLQEDMSALLERLFDPSVLEHVTKVLVGEGYERLEDVRAASLDELFDLRGMKRGWARRLKRHVLAEGGGGGAASSSAFNTPSPNASANSSFENSASSKKSNRSRPRPALPHRPSSFSTPRTRSSPLSKVRVVTSPSSSSPGVPQQATNSIEAPNRPSPPFSRASMTFRLGICDGATTTTGVDGPRRRRRPPSCRASLRKRTSCARPRNSRRSDERRPTAR